MNLKYRVFNPSLCIGVNNAATTFFFRLGYAVWVFKGANLLKPLSYYGKMMDSLTDDTETLRGAYGPRLRRWVGPDALQEAINKNQNIDNEEDFVKPAGIDQIEAVYKDLESGMQESVMQIFDPALDFEQTNYVPDLHRISFIVENGMLNMVMDYLLVDENGQMLNDLFVMELLKYMYVSFLPQTPYSCGQTFVNIGRSIKGCEDVDISLEGIEYGGINTTPEKFWAEFDMFLDFEKHMRMQVNDKTFMKPEVSVSELIGLLHKKYLLQFENTLLTDWGRALLVCAIMKYSDNAKKYQDDIEMLIVDVGMSGAFRKELKMYAKSLSITDIPCLALE